jgi:hypothetical protein
LVAFRAITPPVEVMMYIVPPRTSGVLSTVPAGVPRDHAIRSWLTFCRVIWLRGLNRWSS